MLDLLLPSRTHRDHDRFKRECARARRRRRRLFPCMPCGAGIAESFLVIRAISLCTALEGRWFTPGRARISATLRPASIPSFANIETPTSCATPRHCATQTFWFPTQRSGRLVGFLSRPLFGRLGIGYIVFWSEPGAWRYTDEIDQEIRPSTHLLFMFNFNETYLLTFVLITEHVLRLTWFVILVQ